MKLNILYTINKCKINSKGLCAITCRLTYLKIRKLKVGNIVKLIFESITSSKENPPAERMWVIITGVNKDGFKGRLNSIPFFIDNLNAEDEVIFEHKHIIDVYNNKV